MLKKVFKILTLFVLVNIVTIAVVSCDMRTSGIKLTLQAKAIGRLSNGKTITSFTNRQNWKITLKQAYMLLGPFYLMEGTPQVRLWHYFRPWRIAHAHVVANKQRVLAELREHFVINLLKSTPTSLKTIRGIAGVAQTAELHLLPPGGTRLSKHSISASHVKNHTIYVQGIASKDEKTRSFQVALTLPQKDRLQFVRNIHVEIPLSEENVKQGYLQLQIYVDRWFTNVDFAELTQKNDQGEFVLTADHHSISQGIRSRYSYNFSWRPQ